MHWSMLKTNKKPKQQTNTKTSQKSDDQLSRIHQSWMEPPNNTAPLQDLQIARLRKIDTNFVFHLNYPAVLSFLFSFSGGVTEIYVLMLGSEYPASLSINSSWIKNST